MTSGGPLGKSYNPGTRPSRTEKYFRFYHIIVFNVHDRVRFAVFCLIFHASVSFLGRVFGSIGASTRSFFYCCSCITNKYNAETIKKTDECEKIYPGNRVLISDIIFGWMLAAHIFLPKNHSKTVSTIRFHENSISRTVLIAESITGGPKVYRIRRRFLDPFTNSNCSARIEKYSKIYFFFLFVAFYDSAGEPSEMNARKMYAQRARWRKKERKKKIPRLTLL